MRRLLILLLCAPFNWAAAAFSLHLSIGDLDYPDLQLKGIQIDIQQASQQTIRIHIAEVRVPQHKLRNVQLHCPDAQGAWPTIRCPNALLEIEQTPWGKQKVALNFALDSAQDWHLQWRNFAYADSRLHGAIRMRDNQWRLVLNGRALKLDKSPELATLREMLGLQALQGLLDVDAELHGRSGQLQRMDLHGKLKQLKGSDANGSFAIENLALDVDLSAKRRRQTWQGGFKLSSATGEIYKEPIFFDFKQQPVKLVLDGAWQLPSQQLQAHKIWLRAGDILQLDGAGEFSQQAAIKGQAKLKAHKLQTGYDLFVQPWLIGSGLDELGIQGQAELDISWQNNQLAALDAQLDKISIQQNQGKFALDNVHADLHWLHGARAAESCLQWSGGQALGLDFGALDMRVQADGERFDLLDAVQIPFYRGHIQFADASWQNLPTGPQLQLSSKLEHISLAAISADPDLGWPALQGHISGNIPGVKYAQGSLTLAGEMDMRVFAGTVRLHQLAVHELSSAAPVLQTDIQIDGLDLAQLTTAFDLGEMQGGLDGSIRNLQLVGWQPNRFDAHLYSPPDDPLPHRISQRAVDHLTELGQGASAALSTTFLRFFESFAYDALSIKLNQRGARVAISGLPHADGGYYLVKGAGFPRVDVVGHNREVAWKVLLGRIQSIQNNAN